MAIQEGVKVAKMQAEEISQGTRTDIIAGTSLQCKEVKSGGNRASYLLRRMARDFPDHLDKLESGEFKSARQAAIACGIVKVKTPLEIAIFAFEKLTIEEKVIFNQKIQEHLDV